MDPTGVRRAAAGWSGPAASARTAAARLREAQVPRGEPDLSLGVELSAWLDVEADALQTLAVELGLLRERADLCAASVAAADAVAAARYARPTSAATRAALA